MTASPHGSGARKGIVNGEEHLQPRHVLFAHLAFKYRPVAMPAKENKIVTFQSLLDVLNVLH